MTDLEVDVAPEPPLMTASFRSKLLDFDDLAGLVGAPPATGSGRLGHRAPAHQFGNRLSGLQAPI